jgi:Zn-dependent peptidase ImmA (M78 family)
MVNSFIAPILSYEDICKTADEFLRQHNQGNSLPVDIERIVEFDLGLDIFPLPHLQSTYDVDGFISGDLKVIYVDEFIYNQRYARYRLTLAHEVGHYVLHSDLIMSVHPRSISEWAKFIEEVDQEAYDWLEYQAFTFARAVLVPREDLQRHFLKEKERLKGKIDFVRSKGLPADSIQEYVVNAIATSLISAYDVSADVLTRRITKEMEKGHLILE